MKSVTKKTLSAAGALMLGAAVAMPTFAAHDKPYVGTISKPKIALNCTSGKLFVINRTGQDIKVKNNVYKKRFIYKRIFPDYQLRIPLTKLQRIGKEFLSVRVGQWNVKGNRFTCLIPKSCLNKVTTPGYDSMYRTSYLTCKRVGWGGR